jgi:hypothetical protein
LRRLAGFFLAAWMSAATAGADGRLYGVLQGSPERADQGRRAGWNVAVVSLAWSAFEPVPGRVDEAVVRRVEEEARALRKLGYRLQLDLGMQYPPAWLFDLPHSRYRNQFGQEYHSSSPGRNMPNFVFNQAVRERLAEYMENVFSRLGTDWDWVRLGGGFYGEVNYPPHRHDGHSNCYWAFDALAQGGGSGLPAGVKPCPVPGWLPGAGSLDNRSARQFLDWYHGSLQNYHDWQITTARRWFSGGLCLLYGSWGIRPGWNEAAIATHLDGSSPAEKNGEIQTGYDWQRMVAGIRDPRAIVYCTWLDAPPKDCDDDGENPERWSPAHWLAALADAHPLKLQKWGENTGNGTPAAMATTFARIQRYGLMGVVWAFEPDLFAEPNPKGLATFADFAKFIRQNP